MINSAENGWCCTLQTETIKNIHMHKCTLNKSKGYNNIHRDLSVSFLNYWYSVSVTKILAINFIYSTCEWDLIFSLSKESPCERCAKDLSVYSMCQNETIQVCFSEHLIAFDLFIFSQRKLKHNTWLSHLLHERKDVMSPFMCKTFLYNTQKLLVHRLHFKMLLL